MTETQVVDITESVRDSGENTVESFAVKKRAPGRPAKRKRETAASKSKKPKLEKTDDDQILSRVPEEVKEPSTEIVDEGTETSRKDCVADDADTNTEEGTHVDSIVCTSDGGFSGVSLVLITDRTDRTKNEFRTTLAVSWMDPSRVPSRVSSVNTLAQGISDVLGIEKGTRKSPVLATRYRDAYCDVLYSRWAFALADKPGMFRIVSNNANFYGDAFLKIKQDGGKLGLFIYDITNYTYPHTSFVAFHSLSRTLAMESMQEFLSVTPILSINGNAIVNPKKLFDVGTAPLEKIKETCATVGKSEVLEVMCQTQKIHVIGLPATEPVLQ
jgi:hypothetical protein